MAIVCVDCQQVYHLRSKNLFCPSCGKSVKKVERKDAGYTGSCRVITMRVTSRPLVLSVASG